MMWYNLNGNMRDWIKRLAVIEAILSRDIASGACIKQSKKWES